MATQCTHMRHRLPLLLLLAVGAAGAAGSGSGTLILGEGEDWGGKREKRVEGDGRRKA